MHTRTIRLVRCAAAGVLTLSAGLALAAVTAAPAGATVTTMTLFTTPGGSGATCSATAPCSVHEALSKAAGDLGDAVIIHLAKGTYDGNVEVNSSGLASLSLVGSGTSGATLTELDATNTTRVMTIGGNAPVVVSTLKLSTGSSSSTAGCLFAYGTVISMTHVQVVHCASAGVAGAIEVSASTKLTIDTASVSTSSARYTAGGIDNYGDLGLTGVTLDHDVSGNFGGAIETWLHSSITDAKFQHDSAVSDGGAVLAEKTRMPQSTTLTDVTASTDTSGGGGGVAAVATSTVTLTDVTVEHSFGNSGGGLLDHYSTVHVSDSTFSDDTASTGGGVAAEHAYLQLAQSTLSGDTAGLFGDGGGLFADTGAEVVLSGDKLTSDSATEGGGLYVASGATVQVSTSTLATDKATSGGAVGDYDTTTMPSAVALTNSTVSGGSATTGGGILDSNSTLDLEGVTVSGDRASDDGGGLLDYSGLVTITATTFEHDAALKDGGGIYTMDYSASSVLNSTFVTDTAASGGAMGMNVSTRTTLADDTFSHDSATTKGPGIYLDTGKATVSDSIFSGAGCTVTTGTYTDKGYNVASTHTCTTAPTSISTSATIGLLALAANTSRGPETQAITPKSSAFEMIPSAGCTVTVTERGLPRPGALGKDCDAGAYEYQLTGYDLVGSDGGVFVFNPPGVQTKGFYGSLPGIGVVPNKPVVGIVPTVTDTGYFLVAADGGVFAFGNAPFLGSLPGIKVSPNLPIVGIVAAATDRGYFLVGADGGVYAFGTVPFLGSLPGKGISVSNVIGIAATPSGNGYWVVQTTGKVTAFGAAQAFSTASTTSSVTAIAGTPTGGGYWLVTKEGGVYSYGNAAKQGRGTLPAISTVPNLPVIGIVRVAATVGYWLIGQDGGVFAFGTAPFVGSLPGIGVHVTNIVGAVPN